MLSPGVKAREFFITDIQPFTIKLVWNISKNESGYVLINRIFKCSSYLKVIEKFDFWIAILLENLRSYLLSSFVYAEGTRI